MLQPNRISTHNFFLKKIFFIDFKLHEFPKNLIYGTRLKGAEI